MNRFIKPSSRRTKDTKPEKGTLCATRVFVLHEDAKRFARRKVGMRTRVKRRTIKADSAEIEVSVVTLRRREDA